VAGVRNLKQVEAAERARLLDVTAYDISLDLTDGAGYPGERVFRSVTEVRFTCREPGVGTFIEVAAESVRSATLNGEAVDVSAWGPENGLDLPAVIVTAPGDDEVDFVSRFFAPANGVPEDPVSGVAHLCLAPYWSERLGKPAHRPPAFGTRRCRPLPGSRRAR